MKYSVLFLMLLILCMSCDKRKCECKDDLQFEWKDGIVAEDVDVQVPNAVNTFEEPFMISVDGINQSVEWTLEEVRVYKGNRTFLETSNTSELIDDYLIVIAHDIFELPNDEQISGAVSFYFEIRFPDDNATLIIDGSVYFYNFENFFTEGFDATECRWPCQVLRTVFEEPCQ